MNINSNDRPNGSDSASVLEGTIDIRHLSTTQLAQLGMAQLAYIKAIEVNGAPGFAIHAADGTPMAVAVDRDVAIAAIVQHEMMPALVH